MKTKNVLLVTAFLFLFANVVSGQITFLQDGSKVDLKKKDDRIYELAIKPNPFSILFEGDELHAYAGETDEIFQNTQPNTDINADFNSHFYIFKYAAQEENADYLIIEDDVPTTLNSTHGAKQVDRSTSSFLVNSMKLKGEKQPIQNFDKFYLSLWLDSNKDQYIDVDELYKIQVTVE